MISTKAMRIWTPFGYQFSEDLYIGQKTISFNPERGVCEYDEILGVDIEYTSCMGWGLTSKSMRLVLTPDHPLLMWNDRLKELSLVPIENQFMKATATHTDLSVLCHSLFEPYKRSQDEEDIAWSARIAATLAKHRTARIDIKSIIGDLGGYEAQLWLDIFFHWNKLARANTWMASVELTNLDIRDIVFNIAPRAGVGARWQIVRGKKLISISSDGRVNPSPYWSWFKQPIDGLTFNITTKNGNALGRSSVGTFLFACNKQEKHVETL